MGQIICKLKNMIITMKQWLKVYTTFPVAMVFALSFILTTCKSDADELPVDTVELPSVQRRLESERLVALAVCRVFDSKAVTLKSSSLDMKQATSLSITRLNEDEQTPKIRYAFDFVEINDAARFVAQGVDFPFLNEVCGNGVIEVFLTTFNTYVYADETKDVNNLQPFINDGLIVFRGEWGIYSCMDNSGSWRYDDMGNMVSCLIEYSSHKRFGENAVEKDFTPPLYQFFVKTENNMTSLACRASNAVGVPPDQSQQWTTLEGGDIVSNDDLFSTEELCDMPEISQQCTITGIGGDYFMVSSNSNLEKLYFDEYTLFLADEQPAESADFEKGDAVTVTFGQPYERYNPKVALANKIVK